MSAFVINFLALVGGIWGLVFLSFLALWGYEAWVEKHERRK